jgi:hypothetical protein
MIHANMESYMKLCLESFSKTQNGKSQLWNPSIVESPLDESAGASGAQTFQETVIEAVHHVLVN